MDNNLNELEKQLENLSEQIKTLKTANTVNFTPDSGVGVRRRNSGKKIFVVVGVVVALLVCFISVFALVNPLYRDVNSSISSSVGEKNILLKFPLKSCLTVLTHDGVKKGVIVTEHTTYGVRAIDPKTNVYYDISYGQLKQYLDR